MKEDLELFLKKLKAYGNENNIPNVTDEVGKFLNMLIQLKRPRDILEIGCANGYSTIWMAEAARAVGARVHTIDFSRPSLAQAKDNVAVAGFSDTVEFYLDDALRLIPKMDRKLLFDFVFVDGEKASYPDFWKAIEGRMNSGAVVVFDDMIAFPNKTKSFYDLIQSAKGVEQLLIPIDQNDGILMVIKY
ncbi:MAG: class I SAM-dependent methyltransferase [Patescibacteria group bacterium]